MGNELILLLSVIIYILRIGLLMIGFFLEKGRTTKNPVNQFLPTVSVVVPARNEEKNISDCISSISQSNYSKELFEIIAIDDRSTDRTGELLDALSNKVKNLKVIHITEEDSQIHSQQLTLSILNKEELEKKISFYNSGIKQLKGKPAALQVGIENASGEIILMTDADCTVPPNWIRTIVSQYLKPEVGFVASFTNVVGERIFDKLQAIEWIYMHTMAMGGVGLSQPLGCYGNNISVRRKSFEKVGGYKGIKFSITEDLALQHSIFNSGDKIHYLISPEAIVDTKPCPTFREYLLQHHRWSRGGLALGWRAAIFVLSSFAIWAGLFYFFFINFNLPILLAILSTRFAGDLLLLFPSMVILDKTRYFKYYPLAVALFLLMEFLAPLMVLYPKVQWKGQVFRV